jgi:hypothetical protein
MAIRLGGWEAWRLGSLEAGSPEARRLDREMTGDPDAIKLAGLEAGRLGSPGGCIVFTPPSFLAFRLPGCFASQLPSFPASQLSVLKVRVVYG